MKNKKNSFFEMLSGKITSQTGSSAAFGIAPGIILTFLMVFLIQKSQNKESKAIQLNNELIAASNVMVDIEDLTEEGLDILKKYYPRLSGNAERQKDIHESQSIRQAMTI